MHVAQEESQISQVFGVVDVSGFEFFIKSDFQLESKTESQPFLSSYTFFNLKDPDLEPIEILSPDEKRCYQFYFKVVESLKAQIQSNIENEEDNPYDITTPNKWLIQFETETGLSRDFLKEFLSAYELLNITSIVEDIKRQGGISYQGANSFKIAKQRSKEQESWWEKVLKSKYGEHIATQFKFKNCIFDFINIQTNTIFECKLNLKDFNVKLKESQYVIIPNGIIIDKFSKNWDNVKYTNLGVSNFTHQEHSNYMETSKFWKNVFGEKILVFQSAMSRTKEKDIQELGLMDQHLNIKLPR